MPIPKELSLCLCLSRSLYGVYLYTQILVYIVLSLFTGGVMMCLCCVALEMHLSPWHWSSLSLDTPTGQL